MFLVALRNYNIDFGSLEFLLLKLKCSMYKADLVQRKLILKNKKEEIIIPFSNFISSCLLEA